MKTLADPVETVTLPRSQHAIGTPDDVSRLESDGLYKLVDGRLMEKPTGLLANVIAGLFTEALVRWAKANGAYVAPEQSYQCFPHGVALIRRPDISVVLASRLKIDEAPTGHVKIRPDVAIEVMSPNDFAIDLQRNLEDYRLAEIPLVWIVYPETRTVEVRRCRGTIEVLHERDTLSGEAVLPGFELKLSELFPPK